MTATSQPALHVRNTPAGRLTPPKRVLLDLGPGEVRPCVLDACSTPVVGYLDPCFLGVRDETLALSRTRFRISNPSTLALSGTSSAGMEAILIHSIEPGATMTVGDNGILGRTLPAIGEPCGAKVIRLEAPCGRAIDPEDIRQALGRSGPMTLAAIVRAETSTMQHREAAAATEAPAAGMAVYSRSGHTQQES